MSVTGAADTRTPGVSAVTYSVYDEITVSFESQYTCEMLSETVTWRHIRLERCLDNVVERYKNKVNYEEAG